MSDMFVYGVAGIHISTDPELKVEPMSLPDIMLMTETDQ